MAKTLILTFIARDKPGVVDKLSATVADAGGNWLESRMAHLAEKFAGIARISVPDAKASALEAALAELESECFHLTVEAAGAEAPPKGQILELNLMGPDHPGILHEITHCLAERRVSVEEMETEIREAPMGGGDLFHARARVRLNGAASEADLRGALEELAGTLMVDIDLGGD